MTQPIRKTPDSSFTRANTIVGMIVSANGGTQNNAPQILNTRNITIHGKLIGFQEFLNDQEIKNSFIKLCKAIADDDKDKISQFKIELKQKIPETYGDFVDNLNKKIIQDLCLYDLTTKPLVLKTISEKTFTFLLRYKFGRFDRTNSTLLSKQDYTDFADSLVNDVIKNTPNHYVGELRRDINDDKQFIDLMIQDNRYFLQDTEDDIFQLLQAITTTPHEFIADRVINGLLASTNGDLFPSHSINLLDMEEPDQRAKKYLSEILKDKDNIAQLLLISDKTTTDEDGTRQTITVYHPNVQTTLNTINQKCRIQDKKPGVFHGLLSEAIKRYRELINSDLPVPNKSIKTSLDEYEMMDSLFKKAFKRLKDTLEALRKILDNETLKDDKVSLGEVLLGGATVLKNLKGSNQSPLQGTSFEKDLFHGQRNSNQGLDDVALEIFTKALNQYSDNSNNLTENDFLMRTTRNKSIKDHNKDFPYLLYEAFKDVFDIKEEKQKLFDQYLDVTNLQIKETSRIKQYVLMALVALGGAVGGGYYSHIPEKPVVYRISYDSATKEPYQTLINETLKLLPNELTINANDKIYSLKRDDFWIYEIWGIPGSAKQDQFTGLIKKIVSEHPKLTNKESELYQLIIDQIKSLGSKAKYPILPLIINLPEPDKGTVLIVLTSSNFFQTAIEEHNKPSGDRMKTDLSLVYLLENFPNTIQYQLDPSKFLTTKVDETNPDVPRIQKILNNLPKK